MAKRLKLIDFGRESRVSNAALAKILADAREFGIPEAVSEGTRRRQRKALCNQMTTYGQLVQQLRLVDDDGAAMTVPIQHPLAALEIAFQAIPARAGRDCRRVGEGGRQDQNDLVYGRGHSRPAAQLQELS